ncbi:MAG: hypothetical protein MJZ75_02700 [Paludibacteraceae bacterium]|nr:hypothetical protein [Paludibacteraceae bacterium]
MKRLFVILITIAAVGYAGAENVPFTKATDLYYGTAYSSQYNHQLWFTTDGLTYDAKTSQIEGTDGMVMRLDLMCPSATNIAGTYEIVGPNYADAPYKMNKKYTYWTYFENGGFLDQKLTKGTCTIVCTSKNTYTITYDVQEIDNGPTHQGTITNIPITAITENGGAYTLRPTCTNDLTDLDELLPTTDVLPCVRKWIKGNHLFIRLSNGKIFTTMGQTVR